METFFTHSVAMAEYTPEIADRLFVWPNFVDSAVYRDYGQPKSIPILFAGSQAAHYPWRGRVHSLVTPLYPCLTTPHAGWFDGMAAGQMVQGVAYAKLLNAALLAPTCARSRASWSASTSRSRPHALVSSPSARRRWR